MEIRNLNKLIEISIDIKTIREYYLIIPNRNNKWYNNLKRFEIYNIK